jgi:hypothetical protein
MVNSKHHHHPHPFTVLPAHHPHLSPYHHYLPHHPPNPPPACHQIQHLGAILLSGQSEGGYQGCKGDHHFHLDIVVIVVALLHLPGHCTGSTAVPMGQFLLLHQHQCHHHLSLLPHRFGLPHCITRLSRRPTHFGIASVACHAADRRIKTEGSLVWLPGRSCWRRCKMTGVDADSVDTCVWKRMHFRMQRCVRKRMRFQVHHIYPGC